MDRFDWLELSDAGQPTAGQLPAVTLRTEPTDGPSFFRAAREMRQAGHFRAAVEFYRRAVGFDDQNFTAWVELVDTLVRAKQIRAADNASVEVLDAYRRVRPLYAARALALLHSGSASEAWEHCQIALEDGGQSSYSRCVAAELVLKRGERARALTLLDEAAEIGRPLWEVQFLGGWMFLDVRAPAIAAGFFAEAAHWNPRAPLVWLCLGDCFRELRLYDQAQFYYQRVVELEPTHDLALERQKLIGPRLFGLMRLFDRRSLRSRWNRAFQKNLQKMERKSDEF